jgi:hemerythrin-like domain-containing protein
MKVTEALLGEHGVFYVQFDHLEQSLPAVASLDWAKAQAILLQSAISAHAQLEDELLFSALDNHLGQGGPVAVMRMEHEEIEGTLNAIPEIQNVETICSRLLGVIQVARQHFMKEEQILFPLADQVLGSEQLHALGERWAERRRVDVRI